MPVSFQITDYNPPDLKRFETALRGDGALKAAGLAIADLAKVHLLKLNRARPNKLGGQRTNFWAQAANSIQPPSITEGGTVLVKIPHPGLAQRYYGGEIKPANASRLTIPAQSKYYARRAREFPNLRYARFARSGAEALIEAAPAAQNPHKARFQKASSVKPMNDRIAFWLRKQVSQQPDPSVLPPRAEVEAAARSAIQNHIDTSSQ